VYNTQCTYIMHKLTANQTATSDYRPVKSDPVRPAGSPPSQLQKLRGTVMSGAKVTDKPWGRASHGCVVWPVVLLDPVQECRILTVLWSVVDNSISTAILYTVHCAVRKTTDRRLNCGHKFIALGMGWWHGPLSRGCIGGQDKCGSGRCRPGSAMQG